MSTAPDLTQHADSDAAPDDHTQRWNLWALGRRHRVEVVGSVTRTVTWYVDGQLVATKKSSQDDLHLQPGRGSDAHDPTPEQAKVGTVRVRFTTFGRTKRVTWCEAQDDLDFDAIFGTGGIDFDPEPGSPAALRAERIRSHPRRYAAVAVAGGAAKVLIPLLIGLLGLRLAVHIPWPDLNLPSIPWPHVDLPDWAAPAWVTWLVDHVHYVWPPILAGLLARAEIKRHRRQDVLKAQLKAEADSKDARRSASSSSE